jgi:hypothetical protein
MQLQTELCTAQENLMKEIQENLSRCPYNVAHSENLKGCPLRITSESLDNMKGIVDQYQETHRELLENFLESWQSVVLLQNQEQEEQEQREHLERIKIFEGRREVICEQLDISCLHKDVLLTPDLLTEILGLFSSEATVEVVRSGNDSPFAPNEACAKAYARLAGLTYFPGICLWADRSDPALIQAIRENELIGEDDVNVIDNVRIIDNSGPFCITSIPAYMWASYTFVVTERGEKIQLDMAQFKVDLIAKITASDCFCDIRGAIQSVCELPSMA